MSKISIALLVISIASVAMARYWNAEYNRGITCPHCGAAIQGMIPRSSSLPASMASASPTK